MIILDAHEDIAFNAVNFGRDYLLPAYEKRRLEGDAADGRGRAMFGLPDALHGRVAVIFATLFVEPATSTLGNNPALRYHTPREAYNQAIQQMDYYQRLADENARVRLIRTVAELDGVLATWDDAKPEGERVQGIVVLMENGDPILEPRQFDEWFARGVRIVGPAWAGTRYSGGTGQPGPLTDLGRELLEVMASFGAILDVSHLAEAAFMEAVDSYNGQIIASHSNPRRFRNTDRHLSDDMIRRLIERDGVMGVVLFNRFLSENWAKGLPKDRVPLSIVLDVIDHICQIAGDALHVGIGSDFDGGFGAEETPEGLETVSDLVKIADGLRGRGYAPGDIDGIMSGNMLRKLRATLPER